MKIRQDDPAAPHVAKLLAYHLQELRDVMGEHAFALDATGCQRRMSRSGQLGMTIRLSDLEP